MLLRDAAERALAYRRSIGHRAVAPTSEDRRALARFDEPLPAVPTDPAETIALLDDVGGPATMATTGPRYFGFVNGATLPVALAASWIASTWDQNAALPIMSPVAAKLHDVARDWLVDLFGFPHGTEASFVTGATMANASALAAARDRQLERAGWDVQAHGLFGAPPVSVIVGEKAHSTIGKALGLIGLGRSRVTTIPADDQGRMRADQLPEIRGPIIVVTQAGEVNTGAFDPFAEIIDWARERDAWVHVDGAFGLWALADPSRAHLVEGLTDADSWATDGHKWLNVTYDSGIVFTKNGADLRRSFGSIAGYLPPGDGYEAMHHTPQSSQRARQIEVWAVLRSLGRDGIAKLVQSRCDLARQIGAALRTAGLRIVNDVVLNQVLVQGVDDQSTTRLIDAIQSDGTCWCGPTTWDGRVTMRVSVSGWNTTSDDAGRAIDAMIRAARLVH